MIELLQQAIDSQDPELLRLANKFLSYPIYTFAPRPDRPELLDEQTSFVNDKSTGIICCVAGTGSGKSVCAAYKVVKFLLETPPPRSNTPFYVVSQNLEMSACVCWREKIKSFLPPESIKTITWHSLSRDMPTSVRLKDHANGNNWTIEIKSYDQDRQRLQASSIGGFWCDEQISLDLLTEIWGRCRDYDFPGSKIYTLTPLQPDPELEMRYNEQERFRDWKFYRMNTDCNTLLAKSWRENYLDNVVEELRETRRTGAFASFVGAVYQQFNGKVHVVEPRELPRSWYHARAIDFGSNHPTVCLWGARDNDGRWWIYDEYFAAKPTAEEHVEAINQVYWDEGNPAYGATWGDPSALSIIKEFTKYGLSIKPANNEVLNGIATVQRHLRIAADGKPKLYITSNCKNLIKEMRTYSWHPHLKDKPLKQEDDCADSLRYLLASEEKSAIKPWQPIKLQERVASPV